MSDDHVSMFCSKEKENSLSTKVERVHPYKILN